jgi:hypothetical protein
MFTVRRQISLEERAGSILRVDAPGDADTIALLAPIHWRAEPAGEADGK